MSQVKEKSNSFRSVKLLQAGLVVLILLTYLVLFLVNEDVRASVFQNSLTILINLLFIAILIFSTIFVAIDLIIYHKALVESDEIRKSAYLDDLTGMPNRFSCDLIFQMYATPEKMTHVACALITINNLISINELYGRDAGNQAIVDFCNILSDVGEDYGFVGRNGGNEFLLVIESCTLQHMENFFEQLNTRIKRYNALELSKPIEIKYKYVLNDELHATRFSDLITEVYRRVHSRQ